MERRTVQRLVAVAGVAVASLVAGLGLAPSATSRPAFATEQAATVHPGVQMVTANGQCTSNFVFIQGDDVFLGYAAHCAGLGGQTDLDGCSVPSLPLGTPVAIEGATRPGTLAYSSWETMQRVGEDDPNACAHNDFAFVKVDPADVGRVNPTVPVWGGPRGIANPDVNSGTGVRAYANSRLRQGIAGLSPLSGGIFDTYGGGWAHEAYTLLPAIPGDSGSGLQTDQGAAVGILSTLNVLPNLGSNTYTDLKLALGYARAHGFPNLVLALGNAFQG